MSKKTGLIVDLTSGQLPCCLIDSRVPSKARVVILDLPLSVAVRQEESLLIVLSGHDAISHMADEQTLVFHNLRDDLVELTDKNVQIILMESFWPNICYAASARYDTGFDEETVGFIIYPQRYSAELLDVVRQACTSPSSPIRTVAFIHEAPAVVLGLFDSGALESTLDNQGEKRSIRFGVVLAYQPESVEVVCFDYRSTSQSIHQIIIRDYFRTTLKKFHSEFTKRQWRNEVDFQFCIHSPGLEKTRLEILVRDLIENRSRGKLVRLSLHSISWLKCLGARRLAQHSLGYARDVPQFEIVNTNNIGVRLNQDQFYPLLDKETLAVVESYPHFGVKAFKLCGSPETDLKVSLYAGYSDLVGDSVNLGSINMRLEDLSSLSAEKYLVAAAHLAASGQGELAVGVMPDNRVIGKLPFILPGIFC